MHMYTHTGALAHVQSTTCTYPNYDCHDRGQTKNKYVTASTGEPASARRAERSLVPPLSGCQDL